MPEIAALGKQEYEDQKFGVIPYYIARMEDSLWYIGFLSQTHKKQSKTKNKTVRTQRKSIHLLANKFKIIFAYIVSWKSHSL